MNNSQTATFHCFHQDGLLAKWSANNQIITDMVAAGQMSSGSIMAYGSLNYYHAEQLKGMCSQSRLGKIKLDVAVFGMKSQIEKQRQHIGANK